MLSFQPVTKEGLPLLMPYFAAQRLHIGDYSGGFHYMWHKLLHPDYAVSDGTLILRELYTGKYFFYYPLSLTGSEEEEMRAVGQIEAFCRDSGIRLHFTNVPRRALPALALRYGESVHITNIRRWRDYLYTAETFKTYAGGKLSGQRNHVNKFKKLYPAWQFHVYGPSDEADVRCFLQEYETVQRAKETAIAEEEMDEVYDILPNLAKLGIFAGFLTVDGKIVGFSAGEKCGDTVVVHIEKALRGYEGVYPMLAQQFALRFGEGVSYFNRMDDAGDMGLRKSKLQYMPCEIVDKYNVTPNTALEGVSHMPEIETERLVLRAVADEDCGAYARLARDVERNRYWGYDWREDVSGEPAEEYFLNLAREDFRHRRELPLGIYCGGALVGEAVLHRFGYSGCAEAGVRLLPEAEGKGYAREAVRALCEYAFSKLGLSAVEAKCFLPNERSRRMLLAAGMRECGKDGVYFYFCRTPQM